jgi:hypothetical protein
VKIPCANPGCENQIGALAVKLKVSRSGFIKEGQWFCSQACYCSYIADDYIESKRCGLGKAVRKVKLGLLLLKNKVIDKAQLSRALEIKTHSYRPLGEILIDAGYITEKELKSVLSMQAGVAPINLDPQLKIKLREEIPLKIVKEFHFVVFNFDAADKTIFVAVYDMDYITCLEDYFAKIHPAFLVKFYLEDREKILTVLTNNYPGEKITIPPKNGATTAISQGDETDEMENVVVRFIEFLTNTTGHDVKIDNLDKSVRIKGETDHFTIDIYLSRKTDNKTP